MAEAKVSEDEFIRLWNQHSGHATHIARLIGVDVKNVFDRRRRVEKKRGIILGSSKSASVSAGSAVITYAIEDGVVLVYSDSHHWPGPLSTMQRAILHFIPKLKPSAIIDGGDSFDGPTVSRHPSIGWETAPAVDAEIAAVQDFKGEIERLRPQAFRAWCLGNHDMRYESRLASVAPEYARVEGMHLKDKFPLWLPCWRVDINDDTVVRHRGVGGQHAAYRNTLHAGKTTVTGHTHNAGVVPYRDYRGVRYGVQSGYTAEGSLDPQFVHWMEANAPNWHPCFVVLTFIAGLLLMPELVTQVDAGRVQFRGEVIEV